MNYIINKCYVGWDLKNKITGGFMDLLFNLLKKIHKRPGLYLGKKSLTYLTHFEHGFYWGTEACEEEHPDIAIITEPDFWFKFDEFVYMYYNETMGTMSATTLIIEHSDSEEDAFDKYFELLNTFLK